MALSKPATTTKDGLFSCPICLETLKSPKILPCLHTFCEQCIHECILTKGHNKEKEVTEFSCPVCQTVVQPNDGHVDRDKWASGLQTNHVLLTMMAVAQGDNEQECHPCKRHNFKSKAKYWCKGCVEAFCEECNSKHGWIKCVSSHVIVPIEDVGSNTSGIDLNAITTRCFIHPTKTADSYCCDHKKLCCVLCLTLNHKGCINVKTINEMLNSEIFNDVRASMHELEGMKDAATELLKVKKDQLSNFSLNIENTEDEAVKFLQTQKCKLDNLFETFTKQLHIYDDEETTDMQIRIRLLTQLVSYLDHCINSVKVTDELGTKSHLLMYTETIKRQIRANILELKKLYRDDQVVDITFCRNELLQQIKIFDNIGTLSKTKKNLTSELHGIFKIGRTIGIKLLPTFGEINVQKVSSYYLKGTDLRCGAAIDSDEHIILGAGNQKLHLFDKTTGLISSTTGIQGSVKRVCYVEKRNQVYISCYNHLVLRAELHGKEISKPVSVFTSDTVGSLCTYGEYVYIVADRAIKMFNSTANKNKMTLCLNTNCTGVGLSSIDAFKGKLVYTTVNNELKCATIQGEETYCFKDAALGAPTGLAVLPSGLVFAINHENEGSLHVLSENGKHLKTVLKKFDRIKKPEDIWLDTDKETVYVVGGEYIEVYRITSD